MKSSPVIMAMVIVFLVGGYFVYIQPRIFPATPSDPDSYKLAFPELNIAPNSTATTSSKTPKGEKPIARVVPQGMREYLNTAYHFSLFYPQELSVKEHREGGGALTITFQNIEKAEGFQIF